MKILVIGKFYVEGFARHIAETLIDMGHEVAQFEPGPAAPRVPVFGARISKVAASLISASDNVPWIRRRRSRRLWSLIDGQNIDLAIVCHDFLWPEEVITLKRATGASVAMWFPDTLANFGRAFFMNAAYDALFFKDPYVVSLLGKYLQSPVYYLPECFNPAMHSLPEEQLSSDPAYECDITTAGNQHSWRVATLAQLQGYTIKLWGNQSPLWLSTPGIQPMYQGRGVFNHEKVRAFRGAKIVLNNLHFGEIWGLNARAFEAAGAGAFQLLDFRPGIDDLFDEKRELATFNGVSDLRTKLDHWLPREAERRAIGQAAQRRAQAEHTYRLRLTLLIDTLAGREKGFSSRLLPVSPV